MIQLRTVTLTLGLAFALSSVAAPTPPGDLPLALSEVCREERADLAYRFAVEDGGVEIQVMLVMRLDSELRLMDGRMHVPVEGRIEVGYLDSSWRWVSTPLTGAALQALIRQIGENQVFGNTDEVVEPIAVVVDGTIVTCERYMDGTLARREWVCDATIIGRETNRMVLQWAALYGRRAGK